jgi:hypothetical protein
MAAEFSAVPPCPAAAARAAYGATGRPATGKVARRRLRELATAGH